MLNKLSVIHEEKGILEEQSSSGITCNDKTTKPIKLTQRVRDV